MPDLHTKAGSTWKRITGVFTRVGGVWKRVQRVYVRQGSVWKLVHSFAGQVEYLTPGTFSFVVPAGVTSIHAAVVNGSGNALSAIKRGSTTLIDGNSTLGTAFGGGDGVANPDSVANQGTGGGGAGGYSGNGGLGHRGYEGVYGDGDPGSGGGGGGGASGANTGVRHHGAGVYLHGEGASGAGGKRSPNTKPTAGSNLGEGEPRGAGRYYFNSSYPAQAGGNLRYTKTAITVTPGETLTIVVAPIATNAGGDATTGGGVRIIWGPGRSYPNNAKDV